MLFLQTLINGIGLGSLYLLLSVGLVLIFSILKIVNFAHGTFLMVGGYATYIAISNLKLGWPATILLNVTVMILLGAAVYWTVIGPALKRPSINQLVATFAVGIFLQNLVQYLIGPEVRSINSGFKTVDIFGASIYTPVLLAIATAAIFILALQIVLQKTKFGIIVRAVAEDPAASSLSGIRSSAVLASVFIISMIFAGVGGIFLSLIYSLTPSTGVEYTLKAFAVAVLAGMGNIGTTIASALLLGISEAFVAVYFGVRVVDVLTYGILVFVLLIRPTGLIRGEAA